MFTAGVNLAKLPEGQYVIIPSTFEPGTKGKYRLLVYAEDQDASLEPLTSEWKHTKEIKVLGAFPFVVANSMKGEWKGQTAGGSPNNPTFTNNPQFRLVLPQVDQPVGILE